MSPARSIPVVFIEHSGLEHAVEVAIGDSLMLGAVWNRIPGILGNCGGDGGCATCHVYVDPEWIDRTGLPNPGEKRTLRFAFDRKSNSRLACQLTATETFAGLVLRLPRRQF